MSFQLMVEFRFAVIAVAVRLWSHADTRHACEHETRGAVIIIIGANGSGGGDGGSSRTVAATPSQTFLHRCLACVCTFFLMTNGKM